MCWRAGGARSAALTPGQTVETALSSSGKVKILSRCPVGASGVADRLTRRRGPAGDLPGPPDGRLEVELVEPVICSLRAPAPQCRRPASSPDPSAQRAVMGSLAGATGPSTPRDGRPCPGTAPRPERDVSLVATVWHLEVDLHWADRSWPSFETGRVPDETGDGGGHDEHDGDIESPEEARIHRCIAVPRSPPRDRPPVVLGLAVAAGIFVGGGASRARASTRSPSRGPTTIMVPGASPVIWSLIRDLSSTDNQRYLPRVGAHPIVGEKMCFDQVRPRAALSRGALACRRRPASGGCTSKTG